MQSKAIEVIRHSLNAANAALDLLQSAPVEALVETVVETAPVSIVAVAQTVVESAPVSVVESATSTVAITQFGRLMEELNHPRYTLRTVAELEDMLCLDVESALDDSNIDVVYKTRRGDQARLVGLASRN